MCTAFVVDDDDGSDMSIVIAVRKVNKSEDSRNQLDQENGVHKEG
jgi:hypothetical protein